MKHPDGSQVIMSSHTEVDEFLEDHVEEESSCCDNMKISKEDGFFVCCHVNYQNTQKI